MRILQFEMGGRPPPTVQLRCASGRQGPVTADTLNDLPPFPVRTTPVTYETVPGGRIHSVGWPVISAMRSKSLS